MILVNNGLVNGWIGEYIGRGGKGKKASALANPFKLTDTASREEVIEKYRYWLWSELKDETSPQFLALKDLARKKLEKEVEGKHLILDCFCSPNPCHGDVVKAAINWYLQNYHIYPEKIISGGQTGADFAGLVAAKCLGIKTGGTAPKGYRISMGDGSEGSNPFLGTSFGLVEHPSPAWKPRTVQNVVDSDGTLLVGFIDSPGSKQTIIACEDNSKPYICNPTPAELRNWLIKNKVKTLNVAGNRESKFNPDIFTKTFLLVTSSLQNA